MIGFYKKLALRRVHKCAGLSIWKDKSQHLHASFVLITRKNGEIVINNSVTSNSLDEILKEVPPGIPLVLVMDGTNVVHKIVSKQDPADQHVAMALPGANAKDFCIRRQVISEGRIIVSLLRQNEVDHLVKVLNNAGIFIWEIFLGPFVLETLKKGHTDIDRIIIPFYNISFLNGKISNYERTNIPCEKEQSIFIGTYELAKECLVSFAACLYFYNGTWKNETCSLISSQREEFLAKRILVATLVPFVLVVFVSLFINFLLFMEYEKESTLYQTIILNERNQISELDSLEKEISVKQKVLETKLKRGSNYLAYYSDRIASIVPSGIILQEMVINPQVSNSRGQNIFEFSENKIIIKGISDSSISLEIFVKELSSFIWIENTRILNFNETKEGVRFFSLELTLADIK